MPRTVKSGESFQVFAAQIAVENKNNTDAAIHISLDGETFYDTEKVAAANDLTLVQIGGPNLFCKLVGSADDEYSIGG